MALINPDLSVLQIWKIPEEYLLLSDHELILLEWEDLEIRGQEKYQLATKEWSIKNLLQDKKFWLAAKEDWEKVSGEQKYLTSDCTKEDLDKEME